MRVIAPCPTPFVDHPSAGLLNVPLWRLGLELSPMIAFQLPAHFLPPFLRPILSLVLLKKRAISIPCWTALSNVE
ncbi:hypothetical protein OROGR_033901 [Orobanche gracilis]